MERFDLINFLIQQNGYKTYLEIGTQNSENGVRINCEYKVGVDPNPTQRQDKDFNAFYQVTSDQFFQSNIETFDIIFIDGDHSHLQSRKDVLNAMKVLNDGGYIVMHDSNPHCEEYCQLIWNGEVYRTIKDLHEMGFKLAIADFDHGCAIIAKSKNEDTGVFNRGLTYGEWCLFRDSNIKMLSEDTFTITTNITPEPVPENVDIKVEEEPLKKKRGRKKKE